MGIGFGFGIGPFRVGVGTRGRRRGRGSSSSGKRQPAQRYYTRAEREADRRLQEEIDARHAAVVADMEALELRHQAEAAEAAAATADFYRELEASAMAQIQFYGPGYDEQARIVEGKYIHSPTERASIIARCEKDAREHAANARIFERKARRGDAH